MDWETFILSMIAGIALFLYGMELLTDSMKLVLGDRFKVMIEHVTKTRFHGFLLGGALTIACQSSTIVTVLIVGLVGVDLMTFEQSIGIILGSNLGSTVTGQIISFNITKYYTAIISLGVFTTMLVSKQRRIISLIGNAIIGLGVILLGMDIMSSAAKILKTEPAFMDFVEAISNRIVAVIVGIVITVILQSSGVVSAILLSLASQGLLSLDIGIAIMIGANLGSCSTALIAGMRQSRVAQQVAFAHTFFNIVLVLLWTPMLPLMMDFVRLLPPHADDSSDDFIKRSTEIPRQIANAHTFMNLFTLIFLFPFTKQMAWIITKIRPAGVPVKSTSTSISTSLSPPQSQQDQNPILPPLEPQYLNQAYLSLPSVQLGWHVLIKETHRLTMCFTDAFQLITQTLVHAQQHQHQQSIMELYQHHHDHPYVDVKHNSISSITPAAAAGTGTMPSSSSPSARECPSSSSWESVFSHDVNDELSLRASWATQLWSYHGTIRAFHSSLVASFDSLTTRQTSNLLNFSMILQYLQMAIQVIHEQIITPAKSHIHGKQQQQNDISTKDTAFFQLIALVHQSWADVAIAIAQLEMDNTPTSTAAGSPTVTVTPAQRVLHVSSEVSHLVRLTITSCGSSSNIASLTRALKKIYYCGWHIAKLTMEAQLQLQEGGSNGNGYVGRSSIPSEKNNTLYNAVLKIISLNNMTHMNRSSAGSGLESTHTTATINRQPSSSSSSSVVNIHTDPDPESIVITSPTAHDHFSTCSTASHTDSDNTPSNRVHGAQTNDQHSTDGRSQRMFHGIDIAEPYT